MPKKKGKAKAKKAPKTRASKRKPQSTRHYQFVGKVFLMNNTKTNNKAFCVKCEKEMRKIAWMIKNVFYCHEHYNEELKNE